MTGRPLTRRTRLLSSAAGAASTLFVLACSAPPGSGEDDGDIPEFGGIPGVGSPPPNTPAMPDAETSGTPPTSGTPTTGAGGSGNEAVGSGAPLTPAPSNGNGQGSGGAAMVTPPPGGSVGAAGSSMTPPGAGGGSMMPGGGDPGPVTPPTNPPQDPPPVTPPPVTPAPSGDCSGQFFCDGFESVGDGASPTPALWTIIDGYAEREQSANVQVSGDNARGGQQALRVANTNSRTGVVAALPAQRYFVRAFLMADAVPLGPVFIGLGTDQNSEIRLRIQGQSFATINAIPGDAVRPSNANGGGCPTCVTLTANEWFCAEMFVDNAARNATLWIDGVEAASIVNGDAGWPAQPANPSVFLGVMALQGGSTGVWIDDVVAGPNRIGCN